MISKSQALAELHQIRLQLDKQSENISRKLELGEDALRNGDNSSEARAFRVVMAMLDSRIELYQAVFKTIAAVEHLAEQLESLWNRTTDEEPSR